MSTQHVKIRRKKKKRWWGGGSKKSFEIAEDVKRKRKVYFQPFLQPSELGFFSSLFRMQEEDHFL